MFPSPQHTLENTLQVYYPGLLLPHQGSFNNALCPHRPHLRLVEPMGGEYLMIAPDQKFLLSYSLLILVLVSFQGGDEQVENES